MGKRPAIAVAIIATIVIIFGLSFFIMPITSISISENIGMGENLVIEASAFYLSPIPLTFNCAEVYYTISWWDDNDGEWVEVFETPRAECMCSKFYINKDYRRTWSPEEDGWGWYISENGGAVIKDALPGHYKIDITVLRGDHEFEFNLRHEE